MSHKFYTPSRLIICLAATAMMVSACASQPEQRGSDRGERAERGERGPRAQARGSGTFMQPVAALFIGMDSNQDKIISRAELESGVSNEWSSFDRNPSATYFALWSENTLGSTDALPNFLSFDKDFSGVISKDEFSDQLTTHFNGMDKNKDGNLGRSEMIVAFQARSGNSRGNGAEGGGRGGNRSGGQGSGRRGGGQGGARPQR
ncbi:MAG: hypothetical protein ABJ275_10515 [Maricaulaceae bacterium]